MLSPADRSRKQNLWLRQLCSVEDAALEMVRPIDLTTMQPEIVEVGAGTMRALHDYWRVMISSEPQGLSFSGGGRSSALLVRDKVSGGILGVTALADPNIKPLSALVHWDGTALGNASRLARQHQVTMLKRCLPIYEFGQMTGGKLLALMSTSRDVIRLMELRFSFQYAFLAIRTLHGRGSQYNRLQERGIELYEVDGEGKGFYGMELRKKGIAYLRDGRPMGKTNTRPLGEQIEYWRTRWLPNRMLSQDNPRGLIFPDKERYRLSSHMAEKKMTPARLAHLETESGPDDQEE